jgi:hypothetical protein
VQNEQLLYTMYCVPKCLFWLTNLAGIDRLLLSNLLRIPTGCLNPADTRLRVRRLIATTSKGLAGDCLMRLTGVYI